MSAPPFDDRTARYVARIQALPKLDRDAELQLAREFRDRRDSEAARRIIEANLRHVVAMALRYRRLGVSVEELIAQGSVGLMTALERFDPERGLRLATYANHWVRAEMLSFVLRSRTLVGGGRGDLRGRYAFQLKRDYARLASQHGHTSTTLELLSRRYQKPAAELAQLLLRQEQRDASLDAAPAGDAELTLHEQLADAVIDREREYTQAQAQPELERAVAALTAELGERERFIVEHRLLADAECQSTLEDIGRQFGVSRERVRQLELRIKSKLRERLSALVARHELLSAA